MSVKVVIECNLTQGKTGELEAFLLANVPTVRCFSGCERVSISFDENSAVMVIDEDWQSVSHHQKYMQFISDNGVLQQLKSFMSAPPTIRYLQLSHY
ncbi:hypothetical protein [Pseudoalteromonas luteoviolacea]|uniref:ABM domain-containing protein n=1 Tax=Pseudoalteromonas luteoviolacea S4054 TaxID=1129367 RepID=A0A0F6AIX2_9GAMM|nr:hypothetical protein [Pseudoalteromonas luteoviolacea]AOT07867.1 hypothetical protein S4054249_08450 [Pseudoalteromonas luteoviolacea]AOT12783.1 hypothetical protein S40542_08450 [Pseudoalteromonas luteoviolacea]AOT17696.1 hypothetical protein S4054_08445 [Pseudoalteromonas luteoviolacea]KKE85894.1 hypothetical protein N479_00540 [Pseudoalteromonas luteoviolacea S4054]KZN74772.1 hypothetical protein N481_08920 [Pseudoalteromonas luteoviolacea S4047-1]